MRINVIGTSGSGKTTFGRRLAEAINVPFIEMDAVYWQADWGMPPDEEFFSELATLLEEENWVLDGNYTRTMKFKWDRVQAVIWMNYSFSRTMYQAVSRAVSRLFNQEELWPDTGNTENISMLFSKDSIVLWTLNGYHRHIVRNAAYITAPEFSHIKFHRIRSPKESNQFLNIVKKDPGFILTEEFGITRK